MAKVKIISMPLRVEPDESFHIVSFVVRPEVDASAYDPVHDDANRITYEIYDSGCRLITQDVFDCEANQGLYISPQMRLANTGIYAVWLHYSGDYGEGWGFTQIHVSTTDRRVKDNLDATISSRASQTTVDAIKSQTDKLIFDISNNVYANVQDKGVLNDPSVTDIDNQLSSTHGSGAWTTADVSNLALESTAQSIKAQTDKMQFDVNNYIKANVQDKGILNDPSVTDIDNQLSSSHGSGSWVTADISNLALESTAQSIKSQTDKLQFDANNYVEANVQDKGVLNDPSVVDIDNQLSATHGSGSWEGGGGNGGATAEEIADAVWDELTSDHTGAGTFGLLLSNIYAKILTILIKLKNLW